MPFFEGAQHFVITNAEMNDVGGDYNKNETTTRVTNSDVGNRYMASVVSKGNTETQTSAIRGNNNMVSVRGQHRVNGNIQLPDLPQLQNALQALPGITLSGIPGVQPTPAVQSALQLLSVDSTGTSTSTGTKPLLANITSPNETSTSTITEPPTINSISPNAASISTVTEPPSVGGPSSNGTEITAASAARVAAPPAAPLVDDSVPKESLPPQVETVLVPPQAAAVVGSATIEKNALKANENLQNASVPVEPKQRKNIFIALVSIFGACFKC